MDYWKKFFNCRRIYSREMIVEMKDGHIPIQYNISTNYQLFKSADWHRTKFWGNKITIFASRLQESPGESCWCEDKNEKKSLRMNRQESWELLSCVCKEFSCHPSLRWINICHLIYLRNFSANSSKNSHNTELSEKWLRTYQNTNQFYSTSWRTS